MPELSDIAEALRKTAQSVGIDAGLVASQGPPILAVVTIPKVDYRATMSDQAQWGDPQTGRLRVMLTVHVQTGVDIADTEALLFKLRDFSGSWSIREALETRDTDDKRSLGGVVDDCVVVDSDHGQLEDDGTGLARMGAVFTIDIVATKG